jgi:hypothetical protein
MTSPDIRVNSMRKQQISITLDAALRGVLEENAEREGRSLANYARRLLDRAARAEEQARPVEQQQTAAA